jgi:hypothetical protein
MLRASVSGSFHRHMPAIYSAVGELRALGVDVLSPADPRVVDHIGEFLFVASDRLRSVKLVQDRHFEAIRASDFLWVVCPDGYTGASTSAEIGFARATGTAVFADRLPLDITMQHYVTKVSSLRALIVDLGSRGQVTPVSAPHFLLDPDHSLEASIKALEQLKPLMAGRMALDARDAECQIETVRKAVRLSVT